MSLSGQPMDIEELLESIYPSRYKRTRAALHSAAKFLWSTNDRGMMEDLALRVSNLEVRLIRRAARKRQEHVW